MSTTATSNPVGAGFQDGITAARAGDRRATMIIAAQQVCLGLIPLIILVVLVEEVLASHTEAVDFRNAYYVAGFRMLHGGNPYDWTQSQLKDGIAFVYPALSALFFAPFALLSRTAASFTFTFVCIALTPATLWVLRVRDWRVYGVTLLWLPFFGSWQTANETALLMLLAALSWRYRDRPAVAGIAAAVSISMKPFMWPLALWLLVTRRWRASAYGLAAGIAINVVSWAVVGVNNISVYLHDSSIDARFAWRAGYSVVAAASHLGSGRSTGNLLMLLASAALVAAVVYVGYVKRREQQALILTIVLMLAASPLVWSHYFLLLLVPMAIQRPRVSWLWALPILMWVCPPSVRVAGWQEAIAWAVAGVMFVQLTRKSRV